MENETETQKKLENFDWIHATICHLLTQPIKIEWKNAYSNRESIVCIDKYICTYSILIKMNSIDISEFSGRSSNCWVELLSLTGKSFLNIFTENLEIHFVVWFVVVYMCVYALKLYLFAMCCAQRNFEVAKSLLKCHKQLLEFTPYIYTVMYRQTKIFSWFSSNSIPQQNIIYK